MKRHISGKVTCKSVTCEIFFLSLNIFLNRGKCFIVSEGWTPLTLLITPIY